MIEKAGDTKLFVSKWMKRREQGLPFMYVCTYVYTYLFMGRMTKSLEKSLRLVITLRHRVAQKTSLSVLQNPEGSRVAGGREQAGEVTACCGFHFRTPLGLWCQVLAGLARPSAGAFHDNHIFKLLSRSQGQFSC